MGPNSRANKTGIYFMIVNSIFVENCLIFDTVSKPNWNPVKVSDYDVRKN